MNLKLLTGAVVSTAFLLPGFASGQTADFNIVPQPLQVDVTNDAPFILNGKTSIVVASKSNDMKRNANLLASYIEQTTGVRPVVGKSSKNATSIVLDIDKSVDNAEATSSTSTPRAYASPAQRQRECSTAYRPCASRCPL